MTFRVLSYLLLPLLLTGCSLFKGLSLFDSAESDNTAVQNTSVPQATMANVTSVSPEVRKIMEEARTLWTDSGECTDADRATRLLDKAVQADPLDPAPLMLRSRSLSDLGYLEEAFEDATRAIQLSPTAEAYATRGLLCLKMNQPSGARRDFEYAEKLNPREPLLYVYRASAAFLEDRPKDACDDLEQGCSLGICGPWNKARATKLCP